MSDKKYRTVNVTEEGFAKLIKLRNKRSEETGENVSLLTATEYAIDKALEEGTSLKFRVDSPKLPEGAKVEWMRTDNEGE